MKFPEIDDLEAGCSVINRPRFLLLLLCLAALIICLTLRSAQSQTSPDQIRLAAPPKPANPAFATNSRSPLLQQSNANLARNIIDLAFRLENGPPRRQLAKWPQPVRIHLSRESFGGFSKELEEFVAQLRQQTDIDISLTDTASNAGIRIRLAPAIEMRRMLGTSFCLATPDHLTWSEYLQHFKTSTGADWSRITHLTKATIFIPDNADAHLVRACLHEEIMQALGPAGDFYYLAGSIFNDDQIHLRPTAFDFLVLRILYDQRLKPGMTAAGVEQIAKQILDELNPQGRTIAPLPHLTSSPDWSRAFHLAELMHHPKFADDYYRHASAETASMPTHDPRRLLTRLAAARNLKRFSPTEARAQLVTTAAGYRSLLGPGSLYEAVIRLDIATIDLWQKNFAAARNAADVALPQLIAYGREDKIAEAYLIRDAANAKRQRTGLDHNSSAAAQAWMNYVKGQRLTKTGAASSPIDRRPLLVALVVIACLFCVFAARYHCRRKAALTFARQFRN